MIAVYEEHILSAQRCDRALSCKWPVGIDIVVRGLWRAFYLCKKIIKLQNK